MNDIVQAINICVDVFCLAILLLILVLLWFGHWKNDRFQRNFTNMILAYHGVVLTYAVIHLCDGELSVPVYWTVDLISFASSALCMYYFSMYVFAFLENRKIEPKKVVRNSAIVLCIIDFFFINYCMCYIIAKSKAYSSAASRVNKIIHWAGVEGVFSVDKLRMKADVSLLR